MTGIEPNESREYSHPVTPAQREDLLDTLLELKHDLGKYILMPVAFLPAAVSQTQLREGVRKSLFQTRVGPTGTRTARQIWDAFINEAGGFLQGTNAFPPLVATVKRALAWESEAVLENGALDRERIVEEFSAVGLAIRAVIEELRHGQ